MQKRACVFACLCVCVGGDTGVEEMHERGEDEGGLGG